jgi:predicted outer membrane repeat protein
MPSHAHASPPRQQVINNSGRWGGGAYVDFSGRASFQASTALLSCEQGARRSCIHAHAYTPMHTSTLVPTQAPTMPTQITTAPTRASTTPMSALCLGGKLSSLTCPRHALTCPHHTHAMPHRAQGCTLTNNSAANDGGALYVEGVGTFALEASTCEGCEGGLLGGCAAVLSSNAALVSGSR